MSTMFEEMEKLRKWSGSVKDKLRNFEERLSRLEGPAQSRQIARSTIQEPHGCPDCDGDCRSGAV